MDAAGTEEEWRGEGGSEGSQEKEKDGKGRW